MNREQILLLDLDNKELTESLSDCSNEKDADQSINDADENIQDEDEVDMIYDLKHLKHEFKSYLLCAAHSGQLVLKHGLKLNAQYT